MPRSFLSIVVFSLAATVLTAGLVVPTGAVTVDQPSDAVAIYPHPDADGGYASVTDDELEVHFDRLNDRSESTFDEVFVVTAGEAGWIRIENDIEGVTFYVDDPENEIDESERVRLEANESITVGIEVDTDVAESGTKTFTVVSETPDIENRELPSRERVALAAPLAVGLLTMFSVAGRRKV